MDIPLTLNYYNNELLHGLSLKYANYIRPKRMYVSGGKYETVLLPVISVFDWHWAHHSQPLCSFLNFTIHVLIQHLVIDEETDYQSFISLN